MLYHCKTCDKDFEGPPPFYFGSFEEPHFPSCPHEPPPEFPLVISSKKVKGWDLHEVVPISKLVDEEKNKDVKVFYAEFQIEVLGSPLDDAWSRYGMFRSTVEPSFEEFVGKKKSPKLEVIRLLPEGESGRLVRAQKLITKLQEFKAPCTFKMDAKESIEAIQKAEKGLAEDLSFFLTKRMGEKGRPIVIGIPFRADAFGKAVLLDLVLTCYGTQCWTKILCPGDSLTGIDGLFIAGSGLDVPGTRRHVGESEDYRWKISKSGTQSELQDLRMKLELDLIQQAIRFNVPVLGVCGGARKLAVGGLGAVTEVLPDKVRKHHTGNMQLVGTEKKHEALIRGESKLGEILVGSKKEGWIKLSVNSVHWAVVKPTKTSTSLLITAMDEKTETIEAFESTDHHFCIGTQYHPEWAQLGLEDFKGDSEPHRRVMDALGTASRQSAAAVVLQAYVRMWLARRKLEKLKKEKEL